jgi:uncharacterized membrane protein (Fun14 family)
MDQVINFASWTSLKLGVNVNLIVIGIFISYLSWITKRGQEYIDKKRLENNGEKWEDRLNSIQVKQSNNEKLTKEDRYYLHNTTSFKFLQFGIYLGYAVSFIGFVVLLASIS